MAHLEDVYCTLLLNDSYLPGAAVLAHSLHDAGTKKKLAVLVTLDTLSADTVTELKSLYDYIIPVEPMHNPNPSNLYLMGRPDLAFAFTKINLWRQIQFRKIVYLDADVVVLRALDELFDIEAPFAAAPDIGWPDAFNTGVMVITPSMGEFWALQTMAAAGDSFDGADQGLLNQYYKHREWHRLSFTYNCTPNAQYQWEPAYRYYKSGISAVHFIGKDKPWTQGRSGRGGFGTYNELHARWWAVYDRHLKAKAEKLTSQGQEHSSSTTGQQNFPNTAAYGGSGAPIPRIVEPEASVTTTEVPFSDPGEPAENIDQGSLEPTPSVQQRKFSAPEMEWDATKFAPPTDAKPEAVDFPTQTYVFNESKDLFQPPPAYPEPPKNMWYEVPETKPQPEARPKPIFPWEREREAPKATRVFADDFQPERKRSVLSPTGRPTGRVTSPDPVPTPGAWPEQQTSTGNQFTTVHYEGGGDPSSELEVDAGVTSTKTADEQWQEFQQVSVNAWDEVPGIDTYVRAILQAQNQRNESQSLHTREVSEEIVSPMAGRGGRKESFIITDFPSAVERPSLPVTPAPVRRPTFWGEERNQAGELPAAEGVPDQAEWDPEERLEQLRRSSLLEFEHLKSPVHPQPPLRELPEHSVAKEETSMHHHISSGSPQPEVRSTIVERIERRRTETEEEKEKKDRVAAKTENNNVAPKTETEIATPTPLKTDKPVFKDLDFGSDGATTAVEEDTLSPTTTRP
ncbi:nucleotide-diphospho-sugar transferase [Delitschia confertaspora ATCC 74209]|uniref:glycogenin glucosyltransferase n=1 Tax=Delitschia confertaspora ATCC 74209 TaxID=1513339 RepID=A0A9P4JMT3_9PLEO|nr:nucleotide-diphospho-sugar transferase [Delitschia confertaspora ATCC 74209]